MKKILLIPSLTAICLAPIASLVGCNPQTPSEVHKVVIDPSSDTADIAISTPEITLNTELVIPYEIINQEKELDADASWIKFDSSSQLPLTNPEFSYDNNKIVIPADKVTTYNITICLKSKTFDPYVTDEEMENAISLRDEEYVQTNEVAQTTTVTQTFRMVMSPWIFYSKMSYNPGWEEFYVTRNDSYYTLIGRNEHMDWKVEETDAHVFKTPEQFSNTTGIYTAYLDVLQHGGVFTFNEGDLSYKATISIESKEAFYSFYFKDKKLTRFTLTSEAFSTDINISYGKTIPQLPHNPKLDEEAMATEMVESISLADTNFVQVRIDNPTSQGNKIEHLEFSPSICHYWCDNDISDENYVVKNQDKNKTYDPIYTKISRSPDNPSVWLQDPTDESSFETAQIYGLSIFQVYYYWWAHGGSYIYDEAQERYYIENDELGTLSFYFQNKRLIKMEYLGVVITFQYDMLMPELPLPVQICDYQLSRASMDWFKNAYYRLYVDDFVSDGSSIHCYGLNADGKPQKLNFDINSVIVDDKPVEYEYDGWSITIPNQTEGEHKIEIRLKFNMNYRDVCIDIKNDSPSNNY